MKKLLTLLAFIGIAATTFAQVTFTAVKAQNWGGNEQMDKLFDGTPLKWCTGASGAYFIFKASASVVLNGYTMVTGGDNASWNGRNPYSWTFYGINAVSTPEKGDSNWELLHSVNEDATMEDKNYQAYNFSFSNSSSYNYYKMEISAVHSGTVIQIGEFIPKITNEINVKDSEVTYDGGLGNTGQPYSNAVDGSLSTNWYAYTWDGNWVVFDTKSTETILETYAFTTASDASSNTHRTPVSWKWYGSNKTDDQPGKDDSSWNEIVTVSRDLTLFSRKASNDRQLYTVNNSTTYRYYKLVINECDPDGTEALGGQWGGGFSLSEIEINPCNHTYYTYQIAPSNQTTSICEKCGETLRETNVPSTLVVSDGKALWNMGSATTKNITYSRTISNDMGTVCLPYELNVSDKTENATYYTLGKYENDVLYFDKVTSTLSARTPAIYVREGAVTSLNLDATSANLPVSNTENPSVNAARSDGWAMVGTIKSGTASESSNSIYYVKDGGFKRCNVNITYKPYRAYITGPAGGSSVKAFGIADDMEDAIKSIMSTENGEIQLYDLSGRKVSKVRNGEIYIMNGRKVMFNK